MSRWQPDIIMQPRQPDPGLQVATRQPDKGRINEFPTRCEASLPHTFSDHGIMVNEMPQQQFDLLVYGWLQWQPDHAMINCPDA